MKHFIAWLPGLRWQILNAILYTWHVVQSFLITLKLVFRVQLVALRKWGSLSWQWTLVCYIFLDRDDVSASTFASLFHKLVFTILKQFFSAYFSRWSEVRCISFFKSVLPLRLIKLPSCICCLIIKAIGSSSCDNYSIIGCAIDRRWLTHCINYSNI